MVTATTGSSSYTIRIGDHATAGSGNYEIYLNGKIHETFLFPNQIEQKLPGQVRIGLKAGLLESAFPIVAIIALSNRDAILQALVAWNKANSLLYLQVDLDEDADKTDMKWPAYSDLTMTDSRIKIDGGSIDYLSKETCQLTLQVTRYSS